jgi:hypothetical protein
MARKKGNGQVIMKPKLYFGWNPPKHDAPYEIQLRKLGYASSITRRFSKMKRKTSINKLKSQ